MKFVSLVFLLVPFVANAADLCVEDNILKCKDLGYTESSCPYGGVACQYDTSLWYCAKWTCADGRLYSAKNKPAGVKCIETSYKDMDCYDCELGYETAGCEDGYVDIDGDCKKIYETCSAYNSSYTTTNVGYCGCTKVSGLYNSNKDELTCYSDCKAICDASFKYVTAPENSVLSGTSCTGYAGTSASSCSGTSAKRYTDFTCNEGYCKNSAGTACIIPSGCAIGDVFYADGSCSSVDDYDSNKTAVGVVYALSATKGGVPYTTAEAEAECFRAEHGRVINLRDLTSDSSTYAFDPTNPYDNSYAYLYFGLYDTDISGLTNYYTADKMLTALQNDDEELYSGKANTAKISSATPKYSSCTSGSYAQGTANYNRYCAPTAANAALSFYPPEVSKTHATVGAGNWYLPALGELALLYGFDKNTVTGASGTSGATVTTKAKVNKTLTALKSKGVDATIFTMTNNYYWTSVEYDSKHSWILYMRNGGRHVGNRDVSNYYVRVSLEF